MTAAPRLIYLDEPTLATLEISAAEAVDSIERLVRGQARAQVWAAPKSAFLLDDGRYLMSTLAAADDPPVLAVKALVLNPRNPEQGLAQINSLITLLDSRTGLPVAVVDGNWVTGVRTAGLSAVAAARLARRDASVAAFIGCGVQAHSHLQAFAELYPLDEIRAFGRGSANRDSLCRAAQALGCSAHASESGQAAIEGADIVVTTVTLSRDTAPFLDARGLKPGAFAAITDFAAPWIAEGMVGFDRIVVDDLEQESQAAQPMVDPQLICGDLQGLVCGEVPERENDGETAAFAFRGLAIGDLALAALAWRKAQAAGVGAPVG